VLKGLNNYNNLLVSIPVPVSLTAIFNNYWFS